MDWKKEYKLSDLFRRQKDDESEDARTDERMWKKEVRLSSLFRRQKKDRQRAIPPVGETGASEPVPPAGSPPDDVPLWKKEIKFSTLFRRRKAAKPRSGPLALPPAGETVPEAPTADEPQIAVVPEPAEAQPTEPEAPAAVAAPTAVSSTAEAEPAPPQVVATPSEANSLEEPTEQEPASTPDEEHAPRAAAAVAAVAAAAASAPDPGSQVPPETETAPAPKVPWYKKEFGGGKKSKQEPAAEPKPESDSGPKRREKRAKPTGDSAPQRKPAKTGDLSRAPLMKAMNLLPKDVQLAKRSQIRPVFIQGAAVFAAVLVAGGVGLLYRSQHTTLHQKQGTLEDVTAQYAEAEAKLTIAQKSAFSGTSLAGEALTRATALSIPLNARINWDRLLRELSLTLPSGVWFNTMQTAASTATPTTTASTTVGSTVTAQVTPAATLTITGYAMDQDGVGRLLARLGVIPELSEVQLQTATETQLNGANVVSFTVIGALKPPPGAAASEAALQAAAVASQPPATTTDTTTSGSDE